MPKGLLLPSEFVPARLSPDYSDWVKENLVSLEEFRLCRHSFRLAKVAQPNADQPEVL
jgi:hypothetical protein